MSLSNAAVPASLLVVCLCAEWCGVCGEYRSRFEQVKASVRQDDPQAQFLWIDVEDEADLLHPLDVDDFPTLLIAVNGQPRFFGPLTPQVETLARMIRIKAQDAGAPPLAQADVVALVSRLQAAYRVSKT